MILDMKFTIRLPELCMTLSQIVSSQTIELLGILASLYLPRDHKNPNMRSSHHPPKPEFGPLEIA